MRAEGAEGAEGEGEKRGWVQGRKNGAGWRTACFNLNASPGAFPGPARLGSGPGKSRWPRQHCLIGAVCQGRVSANEHPRSWGFHSRASFYL